MGRWSNDGSQYIDHTIEVLGSKSQDVGVVIDTTAIPAGAEFIQTTWIDNVEWVRNLLILEQTDQAHDVKVYRRDRAGTVDWGTAINTGLAATNTQWRSIPASAQNALLGYSARFAIKNTGAVPTTYAKMRVQLLGQ